jgi:hypothetical protein
MDREHTMTDALKGGAVHARWAGAAAFESDEEFVPCAKDGEYAFFVRPGGQNAGSEKPTPCWS